MSEQTLRRIAIVGGARIPFCRSNTLYADMTNLQMLTTALQGVVDKYNLGGALIDEVTGGAVVTHSRDWNIAREAVNGTTLNPNTPGVTMMQACGTSLQAAMGIGAKIATGAIECGIACGTDTTSDAPIVFSKKFSKRLIEIGKAKGTGAKIGQLKGFSPAELAPQPPSTNEPRTGMSMGQHCELMAQQWDIPRDEQDALAYESHVKAEEAYASGFMDDLLVPCNGVYKDNNIRADISKEKLAELRNAFERSDRGTLTAANSTPLTDGASAVLLCSEEWAAARGLPVLAYMTYSQHAAIDYLAGRGLLMAPTIAVAKMLDRAGITLQDFDFYEIHEAFAAQVLCTLRAWEDADFCKEVLDRDAPLGSIDRSKLNVRGSSLAFGHPFAATGGRILATLAKTLADKGGRGLISVCTAGGMGVTAILESANAAEKQIDIPKAA
ncbi:MAG: acetyl-CoA C-acetyltransferase [Pseudomonadota bacterium]